MMSRMLTCLLLSLTAAPVGAQVPDWSHATRITVSMSNFKFAPAALTLHHGERYVLHLVNGAGGGHDFAAPKFFAAAALAPEDRARVQRGKIALDGHESADVRLIAPAVGSYPLRCTHFLHSSFGMTGKIVVD